MSLLRARDLEVRLGGRTVLRGMDFNVDGGELVGLVGANGAGKSTLLRTLAGLVPPVAGTVEAFGAPRTRAVGTDVARRLGYLPQIGEAHWPLPVRDLVALGRLPHRRPWLPMAESDRRAVARAMAACDVSHLAERSSATLSGGERARVLLARVLAGEPQVLLADEPVAGIDPAHQIAVMRVLATLAREHGAAVVTVLHDLNLAARHCTRLVLIEEGRVAADGPWQQVLDAANMARALGVRAYVGRDPSGPVIVPLDTA